MAFCAWCGNHVPQVSYAPCPRCGSPTNGAPPGGGGPGISGGGTNAAAIVIGVIVGVFGLIAVIGILAAIAVPNMLTAMQRSKQKRSMADMRQIATAVQAYATDHNAYPKAASAAELTPTYLKQVPALDGWGTPFKYECWSSTGSDACDMFAVASAGSDKTFADDSLQKYTTEMKTTNFNTDIVYVNDRFMQYPEGPQGQGGQQ